MTIEELLEDILDSDGNPMTINDTTVDGISTLLCGMEPVNVRGDTKSNMHIFQWYALEYGRWAIEKINKEKKFKEVCPSCGFKLGKDIRRIWLKCKNEYHCPNCGQRMKFDVEEYRRIYLNSGHEKTSTRYNGVSYSWEHEDMGK